jgi:hypothetical protein
MGEAFRLVVMYGVSGGQKIVLFIPNQSLAHFMTRSYP